MITYVVIYSTIICSIVIACNIFLISIVFPDFGNIILKTVTNYWTN